MERIKQMADISTIIATVTSAAGIVTYYAILVLQAESLIGKVTNIDQWIGGGLVGGGVLLFLKWLLKRNDNLTARIDELHVKMLEQRDEHHEEIKQLLMKRQE